MPREPYSVRLGAPQYIASRLRWMLLVSFPEMQRGPRARWRPPVLSERDRAIFARRVAEGWAQAERLPWQDYAPVSIRRAARESGIPYPSMRALFQGTQARVTVRTFDRLMRYLDELHARAVKARGSMRESERRAFDRVVLELAEFLTSSCAHPTPRALRAGRAHSKRVAAKGTAPRTATRPQRA